MRELTLIRKNLLRRKGRTVLSVAAIAIAFLVFGLMSALRAGALAAPSGTGPQRLIVSNKVSFTHPLPLGYLERIRAVPGVGPVTHRTWFGGYYRQPQNFIVTYAVEPGSYFDVFPDSGITPEAIRRFRGQRDAALVGEAVAQRFGLKVGDRLPLYSNMYGRRSGGRSWDLVVVGLIPSAVEQAQNTVLMNYQYLDEARTFGTGTVSQYLLLPADGAGADAVIKGVDSTFANSLAETSTLTEAAFNQAFASQFADITLVVLLVTAAAFVSILMIVGSTAFAAVRERARELAVLASLGFDHMRIARQLGAEFLLLALVGGWAGLSAAGAILGAVRTAAKGQFDHFVLSSSAWGQGLVLALLLGLLIAAGPIVFATRLNLPTHLRRT